MNFTAFRAYEIECTVRYCKGTRIKCVHLVEGFGMAGGRACACAMLDDAALKLTADGRPKRHPICEQAQSNAGWIRIDKKGCTAT